MSGVRAGVLVAFLLAAGCAAPPDLTRHESVELHMGVETRLVLFAEGVTAARQAARAAFDRIAELEAVMSDYRDDSELLSLGGRHGEPVRISDDLFRVLERAQAIAETSDGAFDVTVGPVVQQWRAARGTGHEPDPASLTEARRATGWRLLELDAAARTATLTRPGMQLDLGGIGKGFAADEALRALAALGMTRCLVDVGGDIAVGAPPPGAAGWRIAVDPREGADAPMVLVLVDRAVATSGDAVQAVEIDGVRYSHVIDPRDGHALTTPIAVTVLAPDAATADALASAISVLGPVDGLALLEKFPDCEALID